MSAITNYSQQTFDIDFANTAITVDDTLLQKVDSSLTEVGTSATQRAQVKDQLTKLAGSDGIISGKEISDLFNTIDSFDKNGSNTSFATNKIVNGKNVTTLSGALVNTLLESRVKCDLLGQQEMVSQFKGCSINLCDISAADMQALAQLGLDEATLDQCCGDDHCITSTDNFSALFAALDKNDTFGDGVIATKQADNIDSGLQTTKAGQALEILGKYSKHIVTLDRTQFMDDHQGGSFNINNISDEDRATLAQLGLNNEVLNYYAKQNAGILHGETALNALYSALDAVDDFGGSGEIRLSDALDMDVKEPADDQLTNAAKALNILHKYFVSTQPYRSYTDLSRAAKESDPARGPVSLDVPCYCQGNDSTGCLRTCRRMLKAFNSKIDAKVCQSGSGAHYMAAAENSAGAIKGEANPFQLGLKYIDHCLENGRPVIIGISDRDANYNTDKITDHFIIITGRKTDDDGNIVYTYNDPATSGPEKTGPLYVDKESGMLFRPEFVRSQGSKTTRQYQVAQVRPYTDQGFTFTEITGSKINPPPTGK